MLKLGRFCSILALAAAIPLTTQATAQSGIQSQTVQFAKGKSSATINGQIKGYAVRDYVLRASAGQTMNVQFRPTNASAYFNVLPPNSETALFVGSTSGNSYSGRLPSTGAYRIRVYLMRNAARRNEVANFRLTVGIAGRPTASAPNRPNAGFGGMTGMSAIRAIDVMSERGFENVDDFASGETHYGIFYKRSTRQCVQMTMANTRVVDVRDIRTHPKCR